MHMCQHWLIATWISSYLQNSAVASYQGCKWVGWPGQSGSLGSLFGGSSGSHPQTKSGCDPDITCLLENSVGIWWVSEWTDGCIEISLVCSSCHSFEACGVQKFHLQEVCTCKGPVLYPAKNEEVYGIVPYQNFFMLCYITLKFQHVGHIWIVQWVKWVNRCDPLSTLVASYIPS